MGAVFLDGRRLDAGTEHGSGRHGWGYAGTESRQLAHDLLVGVGVERPTALQHDATLTFELSRLPEAGHTTVVGFEKRLFTFKHADGDDRLDVSGDAVRLWCAAQGVAYPEPSEPAVTAQAAGDGGLTIIRLQAENIKKIKAVDITPDDALVQITGKNSAGKSSCLDSILWALAGGRKIDARPIRDGEEEALIKLDMGELLVTRRFKRSKSGDDYTTQLLVQSADKTPLSTPQKLLDEMVNALSFDPLAFTRYSDKAQVRSLMQLVGIDPDQYYEEHAHDYDLRTQVNRDARRKRAAGEEIEVPADTPDTEVSVGKLVEELTALEQHNQEIRQLQTNRARLEQEFMERQAEILDTKARLERLEQAQLRAEQILKEAVDPGALKDTGPILKKIDNVEIINGHVRSARQRVDLLEEARDLEEQRQVLTARMDRRQKRLTQEIEEADLGVDRLEVIDGEVHYRGRPLAQAADSERLRVAVAIAMRKHAKLHVLRVREGSLLDSDSMEILREMARDRQFQLWIEMVDETGDVGFVIEDGMHPVPK